MTVKATEILTQSLNFYGRVFNKVFWLSVASSILPLLMFAFIGEGGVSGLGLMVVALVGMFFSVYMLALIHQFSKEQNDSLGDAFQLTLKKFPSMVVTSLVFGLFGMLALIPGSVIGSILASGIADESLKVGLTVMCAFIPFGFYMYRCFFAVYFTLTRGFGPIQALKASNHLTQKNPLIIRASIVLSLVFLVYMAVFMLVGHMIALGTMAVAVLEFALQVLVMPLFTIFIYRLYEVATEQRPQNIEEE